MFPYLAKRQVMISNVDYDYTLNIDQTHFKLRVKLEPKKVQVEIKVDRLFVQLEIILFHLINNCTYYWKYYHQRNVILNLFLNSTKQKYINTTIVKCFEIVNFFIPFCL